MTTAYDEVAYPARVFPSTHPDRLATHAHLFGLPYAPVETCRVLDIGGGDGANAVAMAVALPEAEFVSFDLSGAAVGRGQAVIDALGLGNIRLIQGDIMDVDLGAAPFDYMVAHGVYSWIPDPVRAAMMAMIRQRLAPHGVAFVSYNALPGCRIRQVLRDMLLFAVRDTHGVGPRVDKAWLRLTEIAETFPETTLFQALVKDEARRFLERPREVLAHDELSETWRPAHLHEFRADCARHGLQFLTEAEPSRCGEGFLPPYALDDPDFDVLAHAQEMDFTDLRPFRQSLIVHTEAQFSRRPQPARIFDLHTATPARRNAEGVFETGLADIEISDPQMAQAIAQTSGLWPATLPVRELIEDEARAAALLRMYWAGVIALQTRAAAFPVEPGERPAASPLARLQAARGETRLATLNHGTVEVTDRFSLKFIAGLDGSRTQAQLAQDTAAELGLPLAAVAAQIETNLAALARMPLLVS